MAVVRLTEDEIEQLDVPELTVHLQAYVAEHGWDDYAMHDVADLILSLKFFHPERYG